MIEDKLLIWRFKAGDKAALARIYEKYRIDLLRIATGLVNETCVAEDVVHDVFVTFAQSSDRVKVGGNLNETEPVILSDSDKPERWILYDEELDTLNNAMAQLPYSQREAIVLHLQGGMTFKSIARSQSVSINTVQSRYRYGLDKLRSLLNSEVEQ